ncbi:MAG TPA: putative nucleotide-diphospho-sugar transferase, partial [Bacillota bacterium]|nr:putative nucleotide-diphospho-sugar transferase [Bacillota bacterium]
IMIDSDCLFLSNFFDLISERYDFIACQRDEKEAFSEYIASFFVVNSVDKAPEFIGAWREEMFFGTENHKESPALSRLIYKNNFNIGFLPEDLVSYTGRDINEQVRIVHLKSARELRTVEQRIHQTHLKKYTDKYLTPVPLMALGKDHQTVLPSLAHERSDTLPNLDPASGENLGEDVLSRVKDMSPQKRALLLQRLKKTTI